MQVTRVEAGVVFRTNLALGDEFEVPFALVFLIGKELHLMADLERVSEEAGIEHLAALHVVERVGAEGEDRVIDY